jgi:vacuolar protein sorting-associated protein 13A/C
VERLLNKILGEYIENFSAENLKIGIWSGEVLLKNIALKKSIIKKFNLPFRINYSRLGCLRMNIPWKSLTSSKI